MKQTERYQLIVNALWFAADSYFPDKNIRLLAVMNVEEAAHCILSMLDDIGALVSLPSDG